MEDWKDRLYDEKKELNERISKLSMFLDSLQHDPRDVTAEQKSLLNVQLGIMRSYDAVLFARLTSK